MHQHAISSGCRNFPAPNRPPGANQPPPGARDCRPPAARHRALRVALGLLAIAAGPLARHTAAADAAPDPPPDAAATATVQAPRPPTDEADLRRWLENMIVYHRYTVDEVCRATGMTADEVAAAQKRLGLAGGRRPPRPADAPLLVLPYPGGRHPRIGFLEGAIAPQRETKVSVFTPWDPDSYVVVDVPEAIWSNLGLTYLAHTHIPTIWTEKGIRLEPLEWRPQGEHGLSVERRLPNGIVFGTRVVAHRDHVAMSMWLTNHTPEPLSDLRVQTCVLLKGAQGFEEQTNENKLLVPPYAACRSPDGRRWIITTWEPLGRVWANAPCPCLHADPQFPDCMPGQTVRAEGWLSFYEGTDIEAELKRIDAIRSASH